MMNIYENKLYRYLKSVYYKLLISFSRKNGVPYVVNGFNFRMPASCYEYFKFKYFPENYEEENFKFFESVSKKSMTCIDIGAHIGLYSVFMSQSANAQVFSFEPTPTSIKVFEDMVRVNKSRDKIELIRAAVSDHPGKTTFYVNDTPLSVSNSLVAFDGEQQKNRIGYEVNLVSIDDFVDQRKIIPDFIKIDAEGAELQVLQGGRNTFLTFKPSGILGLHPFAYQDPATMLSAIWDLLKEFNLELFYDNEKLSEDWYRNELMSRKEVFDIQFTAPGRLIQN